MFDIEELLRSKGKVKAPDNFTNRLLQKIEKIRKTREFIEFLFSVWINMVIFIFKTIDNVFATKMKSDVKFKKF